MIHTISHAIQLLYMQRIQSWEWYAKKRINDMNEYFQKKYKLKTHRGSQIPMASRSWECWETETRELATMAPLAATAGTPIPGNVESPQQ